MWLRQIKLGSLPRPENGGRLLLGGGAERVPSGEDDGLHLAHGEDLRGHDALVHHDLEHKLLEPVRGHHQVALLAPVLAPGVLHPPPEPY